MGEICSNTKSEWVENIEDPFSLTHISSTPIGQGSFSTVREATLKN